MKRIPFSAVALLLITLPAVTGLSGCSSSPKNTAITTNVQSQAGKGSVLTREAAMFRSRQVHKIHYQIWLALDEASNEFQGRTKLIFDLRENAFQHVKFLRVDFTGGNVSSLLINGKAWDSDQLKKQINGEWIELPKGDLVVGQNKVEIGYNHPYSKSGNGLYRFKDPEDGKIYIYSNLEPYYANLIFPSFDQPDLKASFDVTVEAPPSWTVIGNMPLRDKTKVDGRSSWQFAPSPMMSTYLFATAAGEWKEWKSKYEGTPLSLYARASLAKHVDAAEWFKVTETGLEFYSEFFGIPYPYVKYDQILVPDHTAGAMENIGAVTFNENFVFRGAATEEDRRDRADTILHEMAHMWFGNLVTMRWWNGLWLNESFATYMASVAVERTKLFTGAPQAFFAGMKRWAYGEDQQPTTHPIEVSVTDTNQASSNFDGITYGKGAAALKQLHFMMGDADFQEGLNRYFSHFANRNTSLADFMNILSQSSGRPLAHWTTTWLQSFGYSRIGVDIACDESGKITKLDLTQKIDGSAKRADGSSNVLRPHHLLTGLYYKDSKGHLTKRDEPTKVILEGERASVEDAIGKKCPDLVFPNEGDFGYVMTDLDEKSLSTVRESLAKITDPLTRHLLVFTLWEMVKGGSWKAEEFGTSALAWMKTETNKTLLEDLSGMLVHPRNGRITVSRVLNGEARTKFMNELYSLAKKKIETAQPGSDLQRIWFNLALRTLNSDTANWALGVYEKKVKISGLKLDADLRWDILASVARVHAVPAEILDAAAKGDPSSEGAARLLEVRAALGSDSTPGAMDLPALFTMDKSDVSIPNARIRKAMTGYLDFRNPARTSEWKAKYFAALESVVAKADDSYFRSFAQSLYPAECSSAMSTETTAWISNHPKIPRSLRNTLEKLAFTEGWCAAIRAGQIYPLWKN